MKTMNLDRPEEILLVILCSDSERKRDLEEYFSSAERFPLRLLETIASLDESRVTIKRTHPHVLLLVDDGEGRDWSDGLFQLSQELNLERETAIVLLASNNLVNEVYLRNAMNAGARDVVKTERIGIGKSAPLLRELETSILQAASFSNRRIQGGMVHGLNSGSKTITFFSGRGGVGRSTIATATAGELARQKPEKKVVIVDFDVQFGAIGSLLGVHGAAKTVAQMVNLKLAANASLRAQEYLSSVSVGNNCLLYVAPAPKSPDEMRFLSLHDAGAILSALRRSFDYVVVDLPAQVSDASLAAFQISDYVLLVATSELLAVRATSQMLQIFEKNVIQLSTMTQIKVVLNKVGEHNLIKLNDVEAFFPGKVIARIPNDPVFINEHITSGVPIGSWTQSKSQGQRFLAEINGLCNQLGFINQSTKPKNQLKAIGSFSIQSLFGKHPKAQTHTQ